MSLYYQYLQTIKILDLIFYQEINNEKIIK